MSVWMYCRLEGMTVSWWEWVTEWAWMNEWVSDIMSVTAHQWAIFGQISIWPSHRNFLQRKKTKQKIKFSQQRCNRASSELGFSLGRGKNLWIWNDSSPGRWLGWRSQDPRCPSGLQGCYNLTNARLAHAHCCLAKLCPQTLLRQPTASHFDLLQLCMIMYYMYN